MAWFAIYKTATGELVSEASSRVNVANPLPADLSMKEFPGSRPDFAVRVWDPVALDTKPRPTSPSDPLIEKSSSLWTNVDLANALKRLLGG